MPRASATMAALLMVGCTGTLSVGEGSGSDAGYDSGIFLMLDDAGTPPPGTDGGDPPPGTDAGPPPPVDAGPPPGPCDGITCGANAHCDPSSSACVCDAGYVMMGSACVALPPGDPAGRTQAEVCSQWVMGHVENSATPWTAGPSMCDAGTMDSAAIDDTLRRIAMFRWLAGLGPVDHDASRHQELMECANMMNVNNALSHMPPTSWTCYSAGGASAAGRSNIALGYRTPGSAIDGYMRDGNTPSLGHRRWILGERLGSVEIGFAGRGQCLGVFAGGGTSDRDWTAYPNQGFAPIETAQNTWSFHSNGPNVGSSTATVVRVSDGMDMPVESYLTGGGGPPPSVGFTPMGWTPAAGETYRVTIHDTSVGDIVYETTLVSC
ncbi:MAG: CAP domain-containing protein [Sandaracinaceae bacterium]|nr:CAP domain-containing protein [Sandaracinaceae bacterium]